MNNLETPTIVKSLGYPQQFNVGDRVAQQLDQTVTNRQAFDLLYPTHQDYYNDKKFVVLDRNFQQVEEYLLGQFKSAIDSAIDYAGNANLVSVDDFDKSKVNFKNLNLQNNAPFIHKDAVATNIKYEDIDRNDPKLKITSSDPYSSMFGGFK